MKDKKYIFTYRCRMCSKTFLEGYTGKTIAFKYLVQTICDLQKDPQHPGDVSFHYADDHIGIADLVGCKIEE